jgi:hypothetical protein
MEKVPVTIDVDLPPPVPAGFVPLNECVAYFAVRNGDDRFVTPVSIWRHSETGQLRTEPPLQEMHEALKHYTDLVLFHLRAGYLTAFIDGPGQALSPSFWQYPVASDSLQKGSWKEYRLFASKDELREAADNILNQIDGRARQAGAQDEPRTEDVMETVEQRGERRGPRVKNFWAKVLGHAAAWLAANGAPSTQAELEELIIARVEMLEESAAPSHVRIYASELLDAFRQELGSDGR